VSVSYGAIEHSSLISISYRLFEQSSGSRG
jgi:hypothetical protein